MFSPHSGASFHIGTALLFFGSMTALRAEGAGALGDLTGPWLLFVDDHAVAESGNVVRTYHPFKKHPSNPILVADKPWEGRTAYLYGTVLPNATGKGCRMWYHSWDGEYRMLYAVSRDGLAWEKPELGLVPFEGSKANNIFLRRTHEDHNPQVMHTPWEPDRPYKLINFEYGRTPPRHTVTGYYGAWSKDGIHWTDAPKNPVFPDHPGDVGNFVWDPHARRYLGYPKKFADVRGFRRRCTGVTSTRDFESWPPSELILVPDEFDDRWCKGGGQHTDFYGLAGFAYETMYIGFLWVFRITDGKNDGPIFVELVSSHDGVNWTRQAEPRTPVLPTGADGEWDDGMVFTPNQPLVEGDAIRLYYGGFDVTHGADGAAAIGLATLRKDGFASLDSTGGTGSVATKVLRGASGTLRVNFCAPKGTLRVEVLDLDGGVIKGYSRDDCDPLTGDAVDAKVAWGELRELPEGPARLRFLLQDASLYSFNAGSSVKVAE